ncbi:MAG: hypothetical protein A2Y87_13135 [Bacteroidetes bacterium RBG_13_46_8]|nr:MAG: hypothetical protein A2Y87_13135 [Bacteroidetes bacterium RBG_13_46_8]
MLYAVTSLVYSQPPRWELLGSRIVNFNNDRDEIQVGAIEGAFTALKIQVRRGNLNMQKVLVHYKNGDVQEIELRHNFARGSESRIIDLPGNKRIIQKIVFYYDTKNRSKMRAVIEVLGRH